jgi:hypothetical protein
MSRIDELKKQHPTYALSVIDIYKMISPNQSSKYIEMLIKLDKNKTKQPDNYRNGVVEYMVRIGLDYNYIETLDLETLQFLLDSFNYMIGDENIKRFTKFASFIDRKLIGNNDVTTYSTWDEIEQAVSLAEIKLIDKETAKQIKKVYEDDEWLSLRPLSLEASMKYGANTKWCTTTNTGQYYARYSSRGILIYNINKKTGYKVACFKNLDSNYDNEFSWWDVTDRRIEALDSEAPAAVLEAIRNEIKNTSVANKMLMTKAEADKLELYQSGNYRPGMYENGPDLDRAYRSGGIVDHIESSGTTMTNWPSTGTGTIYTYNPSTFTINSTTTTGIGLGTSNPTAQIQVHGDLEVRDGNIRFTSEGVERARLTANGMEFTAPQEYNHFDSGPTELQREIFAEVARGYNDVDRIAADAQQRLDDAMAEQLAAANERVAEKHLSLLDNIELGTVEQQMIERMQRLAGIETREMRIKRTEAELEQLREEINRETEIAAELEAQRELLKGDICSSVYEAEQPVVHLSLWNKIKNTGKKLSRTFTSRSRKQIGAYLKNVSVNTEAVKQSQEL